MKFEKKNSGLILVIFVWSIGGILHAKNMSGAFL